MTEHTNKRYGAELEEVRSTFLRMGGLVESMVKDVSQALGTGDLSLLDRVMEYEKDINRMEVELDSSLARIMALQQPTAIDLRLLLSVAKMLTDLERSGDETEKVAKLTRRLYESNARLESSVALTHMADIVAAMLHKVLDAFARYDAVAAAEVVSSDKKVDKEWRSVLRFLSSYMIEDPRTITTCLDLMFIARSLERIGDHAKNMGERVIFLVQGEDVRHTGAKNAKAVALSEKPVLPDNVQGL